jgi:hypothetical protein
MSWPGVLNKEVQLHTFYNWTLHGVDRSAFETVATFIYQEAERVSVLVWMWQQQNMSALRHSTSLPHDRPTILHRVARWSCLYHTHTHS